MPVVDPLQAFTFRVKVPDIADAAEVGFTTVSGLNAENEVVEYREGNEPPRMRKLRGLTSFGNITLEKGLDQEGVFSQWRSLVANPQRDFRGNEMGDRQAQNPQAARKDVTIELVDPVDGSTVLRSWIIRDAWPAVYNVEDIDAGTSDVLIESVELAHEGVDEFIGEAGSLRPGQGSF